MTAGLKANADGSAAIQVGGSDAIGISSTLAVTIPGNLTVSGTLTASGAGGYVLNQYTAPATWTKPANLKAVKVTVQGGGGDGGSAGGAIIGGGGGGGSGGAIIFYTPAPTLPASAISITAGTGTNSFGTIASATAGTAGTSVSAAPNSSAPGGAGGTATYSPVSPLSSSLIIQGQSGGQGAANPAATSGAGANSILGAGGTSKTSVPISNPGNPATGYGAGGGGGAKTGPAGTAPGGTSAPGVVIIEEFY